MCRTLIGSFEAINIARSVARLGNDDREKVIQVAADILSAWNDTFQEDGSDSSDTLSEGSSASSTFCDLEKDYSRVLTEMKDNQQLAPFLAEYTKLFESLYTAHQKEKEMTLKCNSLQEAIFDKDYTLADLTRTVSSRNEEIERLKNEVINVMKRADAAHTRELNAQEAIENLRLTVQHLTEENAQKNRQLAAAEDTSINKQKESLIQDKEKLTSEVETLRERLRNMSLYTDELEKRNSSVGNQMSEMQENLDVHLNEISKERRIRQRTEDEVEQLQEVLASKTNDLETANASIQAAAANVAKLESLLKEERQSGEKMQKEISKLSVKKVNLETDLENATHQIDVLDKEIVERETHLKEARQIIHRRKEEYMKNKNEKAVMEKRLQKLENQRSSMDMQLTSMLARAKNAENQAFMTRKQQFEKQQEIDVVLREKNILARTKETLGEQIKKLNHEIVVCEYSRRKIEHELDNVMHDAMDDQKHLVALEKEKEKQSQLAQNLAEQVEEYINESKLREVEFSNYKKLLAEAEAKYRQQQNLFEAVRAERNQCSKSLTEAQDEIQELRNKLKVLTHQIEQLKEDIVAKEGQLVKEEFLRSRVEREKDGLRVEVQSSRKEVSDLKREIESIKREEKGLRQLIQQAESDIGRHKKDIDNIMNERDILGTQLVRRNDELSLQFSRIKVLHGTLQRGEAQYNQRLEEIKLLKLEVKKLRTEKTLLTKYMTNMSDLRQEVFHLNRDLTKERLKVMALEEEVQTPLNIHRWRKLEGSDPSTYELLKKIQILQKRVIKMAGIMVEKEKKVKDTERLYMNLREILSKHPGPQVALTLNKTQKALRERGQKMKCLLAELSVYEVQLDEYKIGMDKMSNEMTDLKKKYYLQKRTVQKSREIKPKSLTDSVLPVVTQSQRKICGGGFSMVTPTPRNCLVGDSACSRVAWQSVSRESPRGKCRST